MTILLLLACSAENGDIEMTLTASELDDPIEDLEDPVGDPEVDEGFEGQGDPPEEPEEPVVEEVDYGQPLCDDGFAASLGDSQYPDLQSALDAVTPSNPWVWACSGVHEGPFYVSTNFATGILGAADDVVLTATTDSVVTAFAWRGGLDEDPANFVLRDVVLMGGTATEGGGLNVTAQGVLMEDVVVREGMATRGGGVWISGDTRVVTLDNVSFFDNHATQGGGLYLGEDDVLQTVSIVDSGFFHNAATAAGGAIFMEAGAIEARIYGTYTRENTSAIAAAYRFSAAEDLQNQIHVLGGGIHANTTDEGVVMAGGSASVLFENVDFGVDTDDNNGPEVGLCNERFDENASFVHWPAGDMYCTPFQR